MSDSRPEIPAPVKREVRQRCGFGCVFCGLPLYEYEHMEGWANVKRHVASEITLLCDRHHREKTSGLLPLSDLRAADRNPRNRQTGVSHPYDLHYGGNECEVKIGSNVFSREGLVDGMRLIAVAIDRIPLLAFTFAQGHLFLTLQVFDDDGRRILWIEQNELRYSTAPWDINLEGRNLVVRERQREFLIDILFNPPNSIEIRRGRFSSNSLELIVEPLLVCYANRFQCCSGISARGWDAFIVVGEPLDREISTALQMVPPETRQKPNRDEVERWMRRCQETSK